MINNISAKKFMEDFNSITYKPKAIEKYQDNKSFTTFITKEISNILENYGLVPEQEYYRIDVVGYESYYENIKKQKENHIAPYAWDLKIAVEHENDDHLWMDEVVKLAHIYCDLRVVIGYLPINKRAKGENQKCLDYAVDILKNCNCYKNMQDETKEFMIIIGNSNTKKDCAETYFNYKGYVFNAEKEQFELLDT